jgi:DNA-binding CsgD family transcriptional regulator
MTVDALNTASATVTRWLDLGRDVLVRADRGAGRSTCLRKVGTAVVRAGYSTVVVDNGSLAAEQGSLAHRVRTARSVQDPVQRIAEDLGPRGVLLVDDLHELHEPVLEVVRLVLAHTSARFVATATGELMGAGRPRALTRILCDRGPAEVELPPLDYPSMTNLVAERLGGPADAVLVSAVMAWSAGNLATALALLDGARFAGVVRQQRGTWTLVGELETVPMEAVSHLLVSDVERDALDVLEQLAEWGPTPAAEVRRTVRDDLLAELVQRHHVVAQRAVAAGEDDVLAVSPPALALALRNRRGGAARLSVVDAPDPAHGAPGATATHRRDASVAPRAAQPQWAAQVMALVHARAVVDEEATRESWRAAPSVRTALPYLALVLRRPSSRRVREVFVTTPVPEGEDAGQVAMFRILEHRWLAWHGADPDVAGPAPAGPCANAEISRVVREGVDERWTDAALASRLELLVTGAGTPCSTEARLHAAAELLAASRYEAVLRLVTGMDADPDWVPAEYGHYREGIRTTALLLSGRVDAARAAAHQQLDAAYDQLDAAGIRVHSMTLAHALLVAGHDAVAWRVLNAALRLGPPGPLGNTFYRRTLTLGAMLSARGKKQELAAQLVRELRRAPTGYQPILPTMGALAEACLLRADGREAEADDLLWDEGARCAAAGQSSPAVLYWSSRAAAPTREQVVQVRSLLDRTPSSVYDPLLELHLALADGRADALEQAVRNAPLHLAPQLADTALAVLSDARVRAGGEPLTAREVGDLVGAGVTPWLDPVHRARPALPQLSERELEVAGLAAAGATNREIAERLNLSRRTVENHVYHALRKLGLSSRRELAGALGERDD